MRLRSCLFALSVFFLSPLAVAPVSAATHSAVTNASPAAHAGQDTPSLAAPGASTSKRPEEAKLAKKAGGKAGGTNGRYVIPASGYSIQVDFGAGTLTVSEPNKTSVYREASPGVYHFTNPTNGIKYGMKVIDKKTIEAFKPQSKQPGTRLTLAGTGEQEEKPGSRSVQSTVIKGKTVFYTSDTPEDIAEHLYGTYLYEKEGEPIVILERDGTGYFQPHGQPKIRINYWLQSSESGKVERVTGQGTPNYQVVLVVQFVDSNNSLYPSNSFRRFQLTMNITGGYAIILGERFKPLKQ